MGPVSAAAATSAARAGGSWAVSSLRVSNMAMERETDWLGAGLVHWSPTRSLAVRHSNIERWWSTYLPLRKVKISVTLCRRSACWSKRESRRPTKRLRTVRPWSLTSSSTASRLGSAVLLGARVEPEPCHDGAGQAPRSLGRRPHEMQILIQDAHVLSRHDYHYAHSIQQDD